MANNTATLEVKMTEEEKQSFKKYYETYKALVYVHKELFGEKKTPPLPELFSEKLVKCIFGLADTKDSGVTDAFSDTYKKVEIKGTAFDSDGQTTINLMSDFEHLFWIALDVENDKAIIKTTKHDTYENWMYEALKKKYSSKWPKNKGSKGDAGKTDESEYPKTHAELVSKINDVIKNENGVSKRISIRVTITLNKVEFRGKYEEYEVDMNTMICKKQDVQQ